MMMPTFKPSTLEAEASQSQGQGQLGLQGKLKTRQGFSV